MIRKLEDTADLFQETERIGGTIGAFETMKTGNRRKRAPKLATVSAGARSQGATQQLLPAVAVNPEATRNSIADRMEALLLASQILNGLGAYTSKGGRKRNQFYRADLNWIADVLLRVDAGEADPLRPWGE
jgi:hypothetical protein